MPEESYGILARLHSEGKASLTLGGNAGKNLCPCEAWGCCFYDEYGDPVTCEPRCEHLCYDSLGAVAATGSSGERADCDDGPLNTICPPRVPCDACENAEMPRIVVVTGIGCDGCSIDCTGLPPSSYCWWKSAEKEFMAAELSGFHVLTAVGSCAYSKQWAKTFYHPICGNRQCTFRVHVGITPSGNQWLGTLDARAWNAGFSATTTYVDGPSAQPCGPFTAHATPAWSDCADYLSGIGEHTVLCYPDPSIIW